MGEFDGLDWVAHAELLWEPTDCDYERPSYMTRTEEDEPQYTTEEEIVMMNKQINDSDGFDIDFSLFRCVFCYHPCQLDLPEFSDKPQTTRDFLKELSSKSLDDYNKKNETEYEFVNVLKGNFYCAAGIVFLITFEVKDPFDDLVKLFQAKVRHMNDEEIEYIFCRPKPNQEVKYYVRVKNDAKKNEEKDPKKPRLD